MINHLFKTHRFAIRAIHSFSFPLCSQYQSKFFFSNTNENIEDPFEQSSTKKIFQSMNLNEQGLTPPKVVEYLDKFVIGQSEAKKAVAISFRNRWRRKCLPQEIRTEITPKNILIQGPTGSGKTEIARRLAKLTQAPFLRVQATKYTEVGYVGKDVSTIIQDRYIIDSNLAKVGVNNYKTKYERFMQHISARVRDEVYLQILDAMIGDEITDGEIIAKKLEDLKKGHYNSQIITLIPGTYKPKILTELNEPYPPQRSITRQVKQIYHILYSIYHDRMKEMYEKVDIQKEAIKNVEEEGIVFIDEIDKLAVAEGFFQNGKGVSTEGVQRDLLPIIEGTTINTKYGDVKTDHILFIASGSFSMAKVDDLIPELLGRLPIRVKLNPITQSELERILIEPEFNLLFQHRKLMETEGIDLNFTQGAVKQIALCAYEMNLHNQNLGARRLHSIVEKVLEDLSFQASDMEKKENGRVQIEIDENFVRQRLQGFFEKVNVRNALI